MNLINLLGLTAGVFSTIAFLPQLIKIIKSRSTKDISLLMYIVISIGILLWLIYGLCIDSMPIILANAVTLVIVVYILLMKLKYK